MRERERALRDLFIFALYISAYSSFILKQCRPLVVNIGLEFTQTTRSGRRPLRLRKLSWALSLGGLLQVCFGLSLHVLGPNDSQRCRKSSNFSKIMGPTNKILVEILNAEIDKSIFKLILNSNLKCILY